MHKELDVGQQLAGGDHIETHLARVARRGDKQPHTVGQRRETDAAHHKGPVHVHGHLRAGHVGDEQIAQARRRAAAQQQAAGQGLGRRGHVAGDIHRQTRRDARARRFARARRALDALQPRQRVPFIGEQGRGHRRKVIAEPVAGIGAAPRIDGHPGDQGLRRQFIVGQQVAPQGAGAHAQHHVVDGHGGMQRLDPLEVAKGHYPRVEHFVRRQSGVEARRRHRVFPPAVRQRILRGPGQVRRRARQRPGDTQRRAQVVAQGAGQQRGQAG